MRTKLPILLFTLMALVTLSVLVAPTSTGAARSLAEQVTIRRDNYGVPHVLAETEEAAAFAIGYAQAEDHPVELARRYVVAQGEQAKVFGESAVEGDFRMKRYGNYEVARNRFHELTPLFQSMMKAYAAGFNLYAEKHRRELPDWIPTFDGYGVLAMGRAEVMRFAFNDAMITAVQLKYPAESRAASQVGALRHAAKVAHPRVDANVTEPDGSGYDEDLMGSNMWAISGSRTTSGKPILLGNPHQPWSALYWEAHITVPGKINFYGSTFIGRPVLTTGFNEHLGWSHTVNYPDLADIYVLSIDPKNREQYLF